MNTERDTKLKRQLMVTSFLPLFFLLAIKQVDPKNDLVLFKKFFCQYKSMGFEIIPKVFFHDSFWRMLTLLICLLWIILSVVFLLVFKDLQTNRFSGGKRIENVEYEDDVSLNFFASFLMPLLMDVSKWQEFLVFFGMLGMIFALMSKSNLFYQNPILMILGYRCFTYSYQGKEQRFIGITKGNKLDTARKVKQKKIADGVYWIYNE